MSAATQDAARRIRDVARRQAQRAGRSIVRAQVTKIAPLTLELLEHDLILEVDDDFLVTLGLQRSIADGPLDPGDTVLLQQEAGTFIAFDARKDAQDVPKLVKPVDPSVSNIPYVTALPTTNLRNGQEIYFHTAAMAAAGAPAVRLRYRSTDPDGSRSTAAYLWEAVGGGRWTTDSVTTTNTASTTRAAVGGVGTFTAPLAGEYEVAFGGGMQLQTAPAGASDCFIELVKGGTTPLADIFADGSVSFHGSSGSTIRKVALAAGDAIALYARMASAAATWQVSRPFMYVTPLRVA